MGSKDGFDASIVRGTQMYITCGERITVVHPGGYLDRVDQGSVVLFETKRLDGERMYWFGRVTNTAYWFVVDQPVSIFFITQYFRHHQQMLDAHDGELDFVDQYDLPF